MIEINSIRKSFGLTVALDDVSFKVNEGEIVAFVGPNGAGKTTALRILSTYLRPDTGTAVVNGYDVEKNPIPVRESVGYLPENSIAYDGMRVSDFLRFVGEARRLRGENLKSRTNVVIEQCGLQDVMDKRICECSKGYRQRVSMAMALIHNPPVLLLDEPTHGLDPLQVQNLRDLIISLKPGKAILFSSHIFQEVTAVCDRVVIINEAKILADGTIPELARKTGRKPILSVEASIPTSALKSAMSSLKHGKVISASDIGKGGSVAEIEAADGMAKKEVENLAGGGVSHGKVSVSWRATDFEGIFADIIKSAAVGDNGEK